MKMTSQPMLTSLLLAALMLSPIAALAQDKPAARTPAAGAGAAASADAVQVSPAVAPLVMLDPTELRAKPTLARGCWVWMFPDKNYKGSDNIAIAGPAEVTSLHTPAGLDWHSKAESLIVGPQASLTVYEVQGFRGQERTFPPGFKVTRLRDDLGFIQSIDALKLRCKS